MKVDFKKNIWFVFFFSIVLLLLFQSVWLINSYQMKRAELEDAIFQKLQQSIAEEVGLRLSKSAEVGTFETHIPDDVDLSTSYTIKNDEALEAGFFQQMLPIIGWEFELNTVDSIFQRKLMADKLLEKYLICYDSTGIIIGQKGNIALTDNNNCWESTHILIVDGKTVYLRMDISLLDVFDLMGWLLVSSCLMLALLITCVIYQTKTMINRHRLYLLREDFTQAMNHDIKNALSIIHSAIIQLSGNEPNANPGFYDKISHIAGKQVLQLQNMIDQLLTVEMLKNRKSALNITKVDLTGMINELVERFSFSVINNKEIIFLTEFDMQNSFVLLDEQLIYNAIANLIDNAIKYSNPKVNITIKCELENKWLYISVKDDGFGISPKDINKIFEKFERKSASIRKETTGFGLGLNYVRLIAKFHDGDIILKSIEGEGSEFILKIPQ